MLVFWTKNTCKSPPYCMVFMFSWCANFFRCLKLNLEIYKCAEKENRAPLSIHLWIPFIYKRCNFVLFNVISFSSELLMRRVKGNYWQRPRHLRCSYQHSFIIMMSSRCCSAVLHLRRCYYTERKYWAAEVTSYMVNCWLINGWATTLPGEP